MKFDINNFLITSYFKSLTTYVAHFSPSSNQKVITDLCASVVKTQINRRLKFSIHWGNNITTLKLIEYSYDKQTSKLQFLPYGIGPMTG